jgi:hypothetical protein
LRHKKGEQVMNSKNLNIASEEVQLEAVKKNGWSIRNIENPSEEVQLAAVKQNSYSIRFVMNPSLEIQLEAVKQNGYSIKYIKNPSLEVLLLAYCTKDSKEDNGLKQYIINKMKELKYLI